MNDEVAAQPRMRKLVLLAADLAGFTKLAGRTEAVELARMLDAYYRAVDDVVTAHRGRVVKFMGDGTLAVFDEADAVAAVDCAEALAEIDGPARGLRAGVSVHLAHVAEAELGPKRRYDVVGMGVNHTFMMGRGPGIRISEPVYRKLPNDRRAAWDKHQPPATYARRG